MTKLSISLTLCATFLLLSPSVTAKNLECRNILKRSDSSRYAVRSVCGEPQEKMRRVEYRTVRAGSRGPCPKGQEDCFYGRSRTVEVEIDEWIYDFGPTEYMKHLIFEQGKLIEVRSGKKGHKSH